MKKRVAKLIVSFAAAVSLAAGFSVTASADVLGGAGLLGSALGSLGVDLLAGGSAGIAALAPWLNGDFSIVGALTGIADGYIKVGEESVIIDGTEYESIFLDPSMAAELHTQAFDFMTQHAITSNSSGILATGTGYCSGIPMFTSGNYNRSQMFYAPFTSTIDGTVTYSLGEVICSLRTTRQDSTRIRTTGCYTINGTTPSDFGLVRVFLNAAFDTENYLQVRYQNGAYRLVSITTGDTVNVVNGSTLTLEVDPFTYDYVAGTIDASPLPSDYGFQLFVPSQTLADAGYSTGTYVIDGGVGTDEIIDLIHLIDEMYADEATLNPEFTDTIDPPPVPPQPIDTPLGEVPYEDFLDTFGQSVYGKLDAISDGVDTVGRIIDGAGTDVIIAVDTAGQSVVDELEVLGESIDTAGQSVVDSVEESTGILEDAIQAVEAKVDELVDSIAEVIEEIMTHPLDLFSAWLDRLPEIPAIKDIFDGIKRHVGIWHYVVEWLSCIGTFLAFFIGLFGDVAYCMVVPIYACVAGAICLAFYKRFAR